VRRLTGDEHLSLEFATTWRTFDLDEKTRTLLDYAEKLTKGPVDRRRCRRRGAASSRVGRGGIYEATALASFFNFSGRLEAASGLPPDEVPAGARPPEARAETP
jgi:alkylhydroperoxidase family enzyme